MNTAGALIPLLAQKEVGTGANIEHVAEIFSTPLTGSYNWDYKVQDDRIKKLYVTEEQRAGLLAGELAIAGYRRVHHIIPTPVADEILSLRDEIFVHRAGQEGEDQKTLAEKLESTGESADPEEHAIPDDLIW